ncbi:MAG TPA: phosphatase domain-containing protein [Croceibacterium sp.]|nr:phosphatase domain-containing protein [Croceibacterium sp.]
MDFLLAPPVRIHPYFGYRSRDRLVIRARALRSGRDGFTRGGRLKAMRTMLAQFASREEAGVPVTLEIEARGKVLVRHHGETDREGFVHFDVALEPPFDLPPQPVWEVVALHWLNRDGPQCVEGHVLAPGATSRLAVISDIDDTIVETGVTGGMRSIARNWRRLIAELPDERIAVPGADAFYGALGGGQVLPPGELRPGKRVPATHRPFFYVSSSPWNLFAYLVAFQRAKGLPLGPLLLRDWGFDRATLGSAGHGAHKGAAIAAILAMYPDLRFALIGDDTQGDLPAYAAAVEQNRQRVAAIFIRTTAADRLSPQETAARALIEAAGVPLWLGDTYSVGEDFLHAVGFTPGGETEQIVRAVEKRPTEADKQATVA